VRNGPKHVRRVVVASALAAALVAAGCGSGDDSAENASATPAASSEATSPNMAQAKKAIEEAEAIPEFTLDAPAFDASKAKGKTLFLVPITSNDQFAAAIDKEMKILGDELGLKVVEFNNQGSPTEWAKGIDQAISQKADAIAMIAGGDPALVLPQLKRAKAAGIPAIISHYYQSGEVPKNVSDVMAAFVQGTFHQAGRLMANYAYVNTDGEPYPLIVEAAEAAPSAGMVKAIKDELKSLCPDCSSKTINVPVADWATKMRGAVQSALVQDPKINYVLPLYDSMSIGAQAGVMAAGKKTPIASYNGTPAVLKLIQDGDIVQMDAGENVNWIAYATMDQALRLLSGEPPVPDSDNNQRLPLRVFDDNNIDEAGAPPVAGKGYGDAYVDGYRKLWGLDQ